MGKVIETLEATIRDRKERRPEGSYTTSLFDAGMPRIAQKVGEEGVEVVVASLAEDPPRVASEMADLVYHCLVLLAAQDLDWQDVEAELKARFA